MKATVIFMALMAVTILGDIAYADQRVEIDGGYCHFAYDQNDDDNEVYFANCMNTIDTYDAADGQGRLAYGSAKTKAKYDHNDLTFPHADGNYLKGADASNLVYPDGKYTSTPNTPCVMVTANYDASNDDQNETVYVTNDWNLEIKFDGKDGNEVKVKYNLDCRGGIAQ